ncbi:hypothetical protein B7Z17_00980 [Candidatus Saccharibacteria bacterium 32-49-10]|nr:MAG: hypothetical protein B7Z17_00980 [Candidatus Saccharibacteria bacterium 32-49-10]
MSLNLPKSTEINRFVAKTNFYKQAKITPKLHDLIEQQIDRITWVNKVAPTTMNISSGAIDEFQSFDIQLKVPDLDNAVLVFIQKSVSYPIIFIVRSGRGSRVVAVATGAKHPVVLSTEWRSSASLELKGNSTDTIYKNYLLQLSPTLAAVNGDTEKHVEAIKLNRSIDALSAKIKKETQINRRQELARKRHGLELELKELIG